MNLKSILSTVTVALAAKMCTAEREYTLSNLHEKDGRYELLNPLETLERIQQIPDDTTTLKIDDFLIGYLKGGKPYNDYIKASSFSKTGTYGNTDPFFTKFSKRFVEVLGQKIKKLNIRKLEIANTDLLYHSEAKNLFIGDFVNQYDSLLLTNPLLFVCNLSPVNLLYKNSVIGAISQLPLKELYVDIYSLFSQPKLIEQLSQCTQVTCFSIGKNKGHRLFQQTIAYVRSWISKCTNLSAFQFNDYATKKGDLDRDLRFYLSFIQNKDKIKSIRFVGDHSTNFTNYSFLKHFHNFHLRIDRIKDCKELANVAQELQCKVLDVHCKDHSFFQNDFMKMCSFQCPTKMPRGNQCESVVYYIDPDSYHDVGSFREHLLGTIIPSDYSCINFEIRSSSDSDSGSDSSMIENMHIIFKKPQILKNNTNPANAPLSMKTFLEHFPKLKKLQICFFNGTIKENSFVYDPDTLCDEEDKEKMVAIINQWIHQLQKDKPANVELIIKGADGDEAENESKLYGL